MQDIHIPVKWIAFWRRNLEKGCAWEWEFGFLPKWFASIYQFSWQKQRLSHTHIHTFTHRQDYSQLCGRYWKRCSGPSKGEHYITQWFQHLRGWPIGELLITVIKRRWLCTDFMLVQCTFGNRGWRQIGLRSIKPRCNRMKGKGSKCIHFTEIYSRM